VYRNGIYSHHATAKHAITEFHDYHTFAIMRSPFAIFRSHYGWIKRWAPRLNAAWPKWFRAAITAGSKRTLDEHMEHCVTHNVLCDDGGFLPTYCNDTTTVYLYEDQPYDEIAELVGAKLDLEVVNETLDEIPDLGADSICQIQQKCCVDCAKLGYLPPKRS
jgi:hypothetical protein